MKNIFLIIAITLFSYASTAQDADAIIGVWEPSHGKAKVKIEKIGEKYYGKIVWLKEKIDPETGERKVDKNNPDESMRNVPLLGYRILKDFEHVGDGTWENGTIYDPENGKTYSCVINMKDENTLDIRGYVGVKTFGRTDTWKRLVIKNKK